MQKNKKMSLEEARALFLKGNDSSKNETNKSFNQSNRYSKNRNVQNRNQKYNKNYIKNNQGKNKSFNRNQQTPEILEKRIKKLEEKIQFNDLSEEQEKKILDQIGQLEEQLQKLKES